MALFVIADLHLSFGTNKPMDIFSGWNNYEKKLEEYWRYQIKEEDTVVIPGDISWAMNLDEALPDFEFIHNLPGKKLITKGNHDYWWTTISKMKNFLRDNHFDSIDFIFNNSFEVGEFCVCGTRGWFFEETEMADPKIMAREFGRLEASLNYSKNPMLEQIVFLHFPPIFGDYICFEIIEILKRHKIKRCYYGHIHGNAAKNAFNGIYENIKFQLISSDFINFTPIML